MKNKDVQHEVLIGRLSSLERQVDRIEKAIEAMVLSDVGAKCEDPKIEVGSWWMDSSDKKAQVTKIKNGMYTLKHTNGSLFLVDENGLTHSLHPCEEPKKETWYLCAKDYCTGSDHQLYRGQEYRLIRVNERGIAFIEYDGKQIAIHNPLGRGIMVSPIER